jgi:hypothetical protein
MRQFYIFIFILLIQINIFPKVNDTEVLWLTGNIDKKYDISMALFSFESDNKKEIFGYYFYQKTKSPIYVKGDLAGKNILLTEYLDNGKENAVFKGEYLKDKGIISGKWIMNKKELSFQLDRNAFTQAPDSNKLDIRIPIEECFKEYYTKNLSSNGSLIFSKKKNDYQFSFDIYSNAKPDHTGIYENTININIPDVFYFESDPEAKSLADNCILFFLFFREKVFVYQYGNIALLDFGTDVNAEGVYLKK